MNPINFLRHCRPLLGMVLLAFLAALLVAVVTPRVHAAAPAGHSDICSSRMKPAVGANAVVSKALRSGGQTAAFDSAPRPVAPTLLDCPQCLALTAPPGPDFHWQEPLRLRAVSLPFQSLAAPSSAPTRRAAARGPPQP